MASISDNFNRADESLTAGPWAIDLGSWIVSNNEVFCNDATGKPLARHTSALDGSNHRVTAVYRGGNGGLFCRASSDFQTGYYCVLFGGAIQEFGRVAAGTRTLISQPGSVAVTAGDTIYMEVEGTTLRAGKVGGGEITDTDSNVTTGTFAGILSDNAINLDDWTAQDIVHNYPTIPTVAAGRVLTSNQLNTTATRTFPALSGLTKNAGDLLIAICVAYQTSIGTDAAFSGWSDGFTEFHDSATSTTMAIGMAYKWSTGSETAAPTVTQAATITGDASMILLSIAGAHASTSPEAGSRASGTSTAADPAAFNPAGWDIEDTLWISVVGSGMTSGTGSWTGTGTTAPTNYTDRVDTNASDTSTVGDCEAAVSFRQLRAASEDVGAGGCDTTNARSAAVVVAVRPAPPSATGTVAVTQANQTSSASGTVTGGDVTGTVAVTQAAQISSASGQLGYPGTVAVTQAAQISTASGQLGYSGTLAITQAAQSSTASGQLGYSGTVAVTQVAQTSAASGTVGGAGEVTGTLAETQGAQTSTATGQLGSSGVLAASQANQTATATGWIEITGTIAETQDAQTVAATGQLGSTGTVSEAQDNQTVTAAGWITITGLVARTQDPQMCAATGFVGVIPTPAGRPLSIPAGTHAVTAESLGRALTVPAGTHVVEAR